MHRLNSNCKLSGKLGWQTVALEAVRPEYQVNSVAKCVKYYAKIL